MTQTNVAGVSGLMSIIDKFKEDYTKSVNENKKLLLIDALLIYSVCTGIIQAVFVMLVGTFPFNSFLSGFICHVGIFAAGASLRLQLTSPDEFKNITPEKAFGGFALCCLVLFFIVFSFMG